MAVMNFDKRLKSILLKGGVLAEDILGEALSKAEDSEKSLTEVLLEGESITEEAIINAMIAARDMTGRNGNRMRALPHDRVREILDKYGRLRK